MVADAASLEGLADGSFDGVTCCLALTDIDDLEGMFAATHRVLRPGGWLAVATVHPCFEPPHSRKLDVDGRRWTQVAHYFEEGRWYSPPGDGPRAKAGTYHRRLSTILNLLVDTGFRLDRLSEPKGPPELLETNPNYGEVAEILGIRASR